MKTIRLTDLSSESLGLPMTVNIERITAWGVCLSVEAGARVLLGGFWYIVRESPEQISSLIAQARAIEL